LQGSTGEPSAAAAALAPEGIQAPVATPDAESPSITLSAVGDCTLGDPYQSERAPGSFHRTFDEHGGDYARPFSGVLGVLAQDDLTIANLEGTLGTHPGRRDVAFAFRGRPDFAKMLPAGSVELVNLANNHSADCGPAGVAETKRALDDASVGWFGLGHADVRTIRGIEVVNLGYTGGRIEVRSEVVAAVKKYKRPDNLVIVTFHWGIEGSHATGSVQRALGHASIDAGADLVLGHHPHVLQGIEKYKGKKIVYSLGNFVFGGNARPAEWESMIYRARFALVGGNVEPIDDAIIPVQVSGDRAHNDFRPILLDGAAGDAVLRMVAKLSEDVGEVAKTTASRTRKSR
jgi:poly-gamma-glutamate synthesis protein (capsule biosynthesis protein)